MTDRYKRVQVRDFDFDAAPAFRKVETVPTENVVFAKGGERVVTRQKAKSGEEFVETVITAAQGDAIVTRSPGDSYAIPVVKFNQNFEIDPSNPSQYRSKNFGNGVQVDENVVIAAPWGEDQRIQAGGVIYRNRASDEVYGNQPESFEADFAREARDGSLMRLDAPLAVQLSWAVEKGEEAHCADITKRIAAKEL